LQSVIYKRLSFRDYVLSFGETTMPKGHQTIEPSKIMGDKSPKSTQKKSTQKQVKVASVAQKKKQATAAKQAAGKKN
jgi:hypothetical protein